MTGSGDTAFGILCACQPVSSLSGICCEKRPVDVDIYIYIYIYINGL